jgi:hypothetical protein
MVLKTIATDAFSAAGVIGTIAFLKVSFLLTLFHDPLRLKFIFILLEGLSPSCILGEEDIHICLSQRKGYYIKNTIEAKIFEGFSVQ